MKHCYWQEVYKGYRKRFDIHPSVKFNGEGIILYSDSGGYNSITIENDTVLSTGVHIVSATGFNVRIGKRCHIDTYSKIKTWSMDSKKTKEIIKDLIIPDNTYISRCDG